MSDHCRRYVGVSEDYIGKSILLDILSHLIVNDGERLYKKLTGRRQLNVMDDICNVKAWKDVKSFFSQMTTTEVELSSPGVQVR